MTEQWTLAELVSEVATRIAALPAPKNGQIRAVPDDRTVRYYATLGLIDRPDAMRGRTAIYGRKHLAQIVAIKRMQTMGRSLAEIQALWPTMDDQTLGRMAGVALPITVGRAPARQEFWKRVPAAGIGHRSTIAESAGDVGSAGEAGEAADTGSTIAKREAAADVAAGSTIAKREAAADVAAGSTIAKRELAPDLRQGSTSAKRESVVGRDSITEGEPTKVVNHAPIELRIELAPNVSLVLAVVDEHVSISPADVRAIRAAAAPLIAELAQRRLTTHAGGEP